MTPPMDGSQKTIQLGAVADLPAGMAAELGATIVRARDQRLRLLRVIKEAERRLQSASLPPTTQLVNELLARIDKLDTAISARFSALNELDRRIEQRQQELAALPASRDTRPIDHLIAARRSANASKADADRLIASMDDIVARVGPTHSPRSILDVTEHTEGPAAA